MRELPTYTVAEQGLDADRDSRGATTVDRAARHERNSPDRSGLISRLNDPGSSLGEMVDYLAGKTGSRDRAGARLLSVAEPVDETPAGKLLYNMMGDVAQYHSDNLAVEVLKGMDTKAKRGGTPYRAPLGYLNRREYDGSARHSYVIIDPERAPLIRWAFEQYALGDMATRQIVDALNAQGLRSRTTRKLVGKQLTISPVCITCCATRTTWAPCPTAASTTRGRTSR